MPQKRILSAIKAEFIKMNENAFGHMEPLSEEVYASLPEYKEHPSEYYDKLLNEWSH